MKTDIYVKSLHHFFAGDARRFDFLKNELHAFLRQRSVKYGEYLLHAEMAPLVLESADLETFREEAELVMRACEIFSREALKNERWLKDCLPGKMMRKLAKIDPGYDLHIPCARFDSFPKKSGPVMIELNTDGCSGMSNIDTFQNLYLDIVAKERGTGLRGLEAEKILPHLLKTLLSCYRSFKKRFHSHEAGWPEKPVIAILDWKKEPTSWEFYACADYFRGKGYKTVVADPSELEYSAGALSVAGEKVHLIYRRMLGEDWEKYYKKLEPLNKAYKRHEICLVGSPRSQIAFNKKLFAYLHDNEILKKFPPKIRAAVLRSIPWTIPLRRNLGKTVFHGRTIETLPFILENKEFFVLKPCVSKCGLGIIQGVYTNKSVWQKAVRDALDKDFIIQEFVPLETALFPIHGKSRSKEKRYLHTGLYVFGGKFSGFFGRTCKDPLLTLRNGEKMLAVLSKKKR